MFKNETLGAYGCIKNTVRSTKKATAFYVMIITALHVLLLYYPSLFLRLLPEQAHIDKTIPTGYLIAGGIGFLILFAVFLAVCSGYRNYALTVSRGPDARPSDVLAPFRKPLRSFLLALLTALLILAAAALAILGAMMSVLLFALVIAGAMYILYLYRPLWFVAYENPEDSFLECLRQTRQITKGKRKDLFLLDLYFLWFPILASLLPYFIFSIPALFPSVFEGMPYGTQELIALILGEVFSAVIYIWKFDYVSASYACFYNEIC